MTISIEQLEALIATAETGSLSAAGRKLGKSQSTISSLINNLEIDTDIQLFHRSAAGLGLTTAGHLVFKDAIAVLGATSDLASRVQSLASGIEEFIVLAVDRGCITKEQLTSALKNFDEQFPSVELVVLNVTIDEVSRLVKENVADMGLMLKVDITFREEFVNKPITSVDYVATVIPQHPLAVISDPTIKDFHKFRYLTITNQQELLRKGYPLPANRQWFADDYDTLISMLKAGFGWTSIPRHLVALELADGSLVSLPSAQLGTMHREVYAVWSKSRELGKAGKFLINRLIQEFQ